LMQRRSQPEIAEGRVRNKFQVGPNIYRRF